MPRPILESRFNVLKPRGLTTGEMHELHYNVDPKFGGGKIRAEFGGGRWSGKDLGWERYGRARRLWYGAPGPLKAAVWTPIAIGTGAAVDYSDREEDGR